MISGIVFFWILILFFIAIDWIEIKKASTGSRVIYGSLFAASLLIIIYLDNSMDPFFLGNWVIEKLTFLVME